MKEKELIDKCLIGSRKAQKALYECFSDTMWGICLRYTKSRTEAEDVMQDGFVKVFNKLDQFKSVGSLEGWIKRIMINTALESYRRKSVMPGKVDLEYIMDVTNINSLILENMAADDLLKIINALPEGYRMVFNLYAIEGYSHREISETLKISEGTSKSQLSRARVLIQKTLKKVLQDV